MDNETLATELLREVKASARRWFVAFCVMVGLEIATIIGFMWYISLPVDEITTEEIQQENNGDSSYLVGGDYNGTTDNTENGN